MGAESWIALAGQTSIIVIAIFAAFSRLGERMAKVEEKCETLKVQTASLSNDHKELSSQVAGISRALARLEGSQPQPPPSGER